MAAAQRDRHRLVLAHGINTAGESLTATALTIQLFGDSHSFVVVAGLLACHTVPQMVWSGRAGRLADRSDAGRLARRTMFVLAALLLLLASVPTGTAVILALIAVIASVYTFADSAIFSLIPRVSGEDALRRRSLQADMSAVRWVGSALGALVAGWLTLRLGYRAPVAVDGVTYLVAGWLLGRLSLGGAVLSQPADGEGQARVSRWALLRHYPRIAVGIAVLCSSIVFLGTAGVLMIGFVERVLHADAALFGGLESTYMWGILAGTLVVRLLVRRLPPMVTLLGACGAGGLLLFLVASVANRAATFPLFGAAGVAHGMDSLSMRTLLTEEADDAVVGQLFSAFYAAAAASELASFLLGAVLGELLPVRWALAVGGLSAVAAVMVAGGAIAAGRHSQSATAGIPNGLGQDLEAG
jgi:MFS family permease